jgi:hypothetical protein
LLFGLRFGPWGSDEFVFGPEVIPIFSTEATSPTAQETSSLYSNPPATTSQTGALLGGLVGVSLRVSPWLRVMPELTVLANAATFPDSSDQLVRTYGTSGAVFYQLGIGIALGDDGLSPR